MMLQIGLLILGILAISIGAVLFGAISVALGVMQMEPLRDDFKVQVFGSILMLMGAISLLISINIAGPLT